LQPLSVLKRRHSLFAIVEWITRFIGKQGIVDANKFAMTLRIEAIHDLHHISVVVGKIAEKLRHIVPEESCATKWEVEPAVPRFAIECSEIVAVAIKLFSRNQRYCVQQPPFSGSDIQLDCPARMFVECTDKQFPINIFPSGSSEYK